METNEEIISRIKANLPYGSDPSCVVQENSILAELGVTSMHLITLISTLQQEYTLDVERMVHVGTPITVGDLVRLVKASSSSN